MLLHTSGFPRRRSRRSIGTIASAGSRASRSGGCNWEPGTRYEYHPTSAHWVLAELIERVTGSDFRDVVRTRVIEPLGLHRARSSAFRSTEQGDINVARRAPVRTRRPTSSKRCSGRASCPSPRSRPQALLDFNRPEVCAVGVPGGGGVATAADIALFYQALLNDPLEMWEPDVLTDVTSKVRNTFPDCLGVPANRTRGLVVHGDDEKSHIRGMGRTVSARAFGHNGAGGQIAFGDPETGASFCFLTNGIDEHELRQARRGSAIASRAGNCVVSSARLSAPPSFACDRVASARFALFRFTLLRFARWKPALDRLAEASCAWDRFAADEVHIRRVGVRHDHVREVPRWAVLLGTSAHR